MSQEITDLNPGVLGRLIRFSLQKKLIVFILLLGIIFAGISAAPFDWNIAGMPRSPIPVDAIPDIGENQQIVFTDWNGRSPQDVEDQITYPMTVQLMGIPGVKTIRSYSYFGFSSIYVIFKEEVEFYWSRSRILEKLGSLPTGVLPEGVKPSLGPDATALGQVYWYTLEGQDSLGNPTGGWDLDELRSINDYYVRYALQSVEGVAEVAAAGGMVREYQIDIDPDKLRHYNVSIEQVYKAVSESNQDVGARTVEINRMEYVIRGKGYVRNIDDLKATVIKDHDNHPVYLEQVAHIYLGPAPRRGALDKGGADVTGGVVVVRYGDNPLEAIKGIEAKIAEIGPGLPQRILEDGTVSKVKVVPFYNRAGLIYETLHTLSSALSEEILITVIVILFMLGHLRSSIVISLLLPAAVLACFIAMKFFGVDANVVALSGIAIAIGTMVDMGIIISENIVIHLQQASEKDSKVMVVYTATKEVAGAVLTAVATTIISFIPVFTMTAAEGKLFKPLAFTKTFALGGALMLALFVIPPIAVLLFKKGKELSTQRQERTNTWFLRGLLVLATVTLSHHWMPLGPEKGELLNLIFVAVLLFSVLWLIKVFIDYYPKMLGWCLENKILFLSAPIAVLLIAGNIWRTTGNEFMPSLDEGSFLLMPITMPHAGFQEAQEQLALLDQMIETIPEVEVAVGKLGRAESSLDPAPISMFEIVINYKTEYGIDTTGKRVRQWRDHIKSPDDIWKEIVHHSSIPGLTSAPKLQPIETRLIMLQTGMRAPMGVKVKGQNLKQIEAFGIQLENILKQAEGVKTEAVFADRIVGKPYLLIDIDREKIARYGITIEEVQNVLKIAVGGMVLTQTVEGRERYGIRVRYPRELRGNPEDLKQIYIPVAKGSSVPLSELANIRYEQGPQVIKSEDTFLVGYVLFDKLDGFAEVNVVENAQALIQEKIDNGELIVPKGINYKFTGTYENQLRAEETLSVVVPLALAIIFLILYFQFRSVGTSLMVFTGIAVAFSGGFIMIWLYGQDWFLNINLFGENLRELFQMHPINLSVAVWVGFIALFGIATDDGVVMATYLTQIFERDIPKNKKEIRASIVEAGEKRIRPCLMTTATTILALLPVLTSTGRGSDIMIPMAIPSFGGMLIALITLFIVPVLYSWKAEIQLKKTA